jgi:PAP2 superfamily
MLRSEILSQAVEPDEEDDEEAGAAKLNSSTSGLIAVLNQLRARYEQYRLLSQATRSNTRKLFYISLLPLVFLLYPVFMFVVIVATGNHFVLDALAGAMAMVIAFCIYPFVLTVILWVHSNLARIGSSVLAHTSEYVLGTKPDIEMGAVQEEKSEEKKGFLEDPPTETA